VVWRSFGAVSLCFGLVRSRGFVSDVVGKCIWRYRFIRGMCLLRRVLISLCWFAAALKKSIPRETASKIISII
jgi:hypothetical protein